MQKVVIPYPRTTPQEKAPRGASFTLERIVRLVVGLVVFALVAWFIWYFSRLVAYLIIGALLAYITRPIMDYFHGFGMGRIPAILLTFIVFFGGISIFLTWFAPFFAAQITELSEQVTPDLITSLAASIEERLGTLVIQQGAIIEGLRTVFNTLFEEGRFTTLVGSVVDVFANIFYALIVIPFVMFFFLKDGTRIRHSLLGLVPNRYFEITLTIFEKIETNIGRYFKALTLQSFFIATVASILLWIVGLQYGLAVGIFAGLANTIPYFGPLMGFLAGMLVGIAQTGDFSLIPGILLAMVLTQVADNLFFQPIIFSRAAQMHPLIILFVVLMGAQLGGIVGMLVAIPLTATFRVAIEQIVWSVRNYRILKTTS